MLLSFSLFEVDQAYKQFLVDVFNYSVDILENQGSFFDFSRVVYLEGVLVFLMLSEIMDLDKMFNKNQNGKYDRIAKSIDSDSNSRFDKKEMI